MIHLIGAGLLGIAAAAPGILQVYRMMIRYLALQQMAAGLSVMQAELASRRSTVPELFRAATVCGGAAGRIFSSAAAQMEREPYCTALDAMRVALTSSGAAAFDKEGHRIWMQLAMMLGQFDFDSQTAALQTAAVQLEQTLQFRASERRARCRSAGAMGAAAGLTLFIILI